MPTFRDGSVVRSVKSDNTGVVRTSLLASSMGLIVLHDTTAWDQVEGAEVTWRRPGVLAAGLRDPQVRARYASTFWIGWASAGLMPSMVLATLAMLDRMQLGYAAAALVLSVCLAVVCVVHMSERADILTIRLKTSEGLRWLGDFVCVQTTQELANDESAARQVWDDLLNGLAAQAGVAAATSSDNRWTWRRGTCEWAHAPQGWSTTHTQGHHISGEDKVVLFRSPP